MPSVHSISPGFHAIHANHLEDLRRAVVWICQKDPLPPLESETFLVQSNGIAQWLKLALAEDAAPNAGGGIGIAAGMDFLFPSRFIWQAYRSVLPDGEVPEQSPFDKPRLIWRLYRLLPKLVKDDPVFAPLARFLDAAGDKETRCFQLAGQIADLFDQYQVFRADWLAAWEAGQNSIELAREQVRELSDDQRWQPVLWRALVDDVGSASATSRSRIHTRFVAHGESLTAKDRPASLPPRIIVFGVSSLPMQALEALSVLSKVSQVVLCVHNPCEFYWADIISDRDLLRASRKRGQQKANLADLTDLDSLHQHANPLLAAWGKQGRDYIRLLDEFDNPDDYRNRMTTPDGRIDIFSDHGDPQQPRVLHQIQDDIRGLVSLREMQNDQRRLQADDSSIVFHSAHSPQREVEVLHDQLLAAFSEQDSIRPRDIIVMVPDIDTYAPHILAVFGRYDASSSRYIPFTISDQGQRHRQPVLIALDTLLSLPDNRFGASEIISLLEVPAVRSRFGIAEEDLPLIRQWVEGANIRWGLHARHRSSLDLPDGMERNTWRDGLRRMLLGYGNGSGSSQGEAWYGIEPYGEIGGLQASVAGNLNRFVDHLQSLWEALAKPYLPSEWLALLQSTLEGFFGDFADDEMLLINRLRRQAEQWFEDCQSAGLVDDTLPLSIVREAWLDGLEDGGLNQRFLAGKVNFATLMPMRAIPFRRVCLLGMNDGDYPRSRPPVDFDLMAMDIRPGDRSRREDDRYLFLEALLSAREQLYISWVGRSIRDDSERPPSVLVSQLRDHLDAVWASGKEAGTAEALTTQHPLQPFSRAYFPTTADEQRRGLFSFDKEWVDAHAQHTQQADQPLEFLAPADPLTFSDLAAFLKAPVDTFYKRRLQVTFAGVEQQDSDSETFALDGLQHWALERELIDQVVVKARDEQDLEEQLTLYLTRMAARGDLGMGAMQPVLSQSLKQRLPDLFQRYQKALSDWPDPLPRSETFTRSFSGQLGAVELADRIGPLRRRADGGLCRVIIATSSLLESKASNRALKYSALMEDWVIHLAGCCQHDQFHTLVLGKEENRQVFLPPMAPSQAASILDRVLDYWMQGQTQPLPIEPATAYAWLRGWFPSRGEGSEERALEQAEKAFDGQLTFRGAYLGRAYADFDELRAAGDFPVLVDQLYRPLWDAEHAGRSALKEAKKSASNSEGGS